MTAIPGKLTVGKDGRITGPATISYNTPWPLKFAKAGVTGQMNGALLHTMDGSLESCINTFNSPGAAGSAHFGIGQDGRVHQFVPLGQGYETYHAYAANASWYGVETEDMGHPSAPISDAGLWAWAQVFECLSAFAGFPCQVTDSCTGRGLAYHRMCHAWNLSNHTCPGATMTDDVRVNQRAEIVRRALLIRAGTHPFPPGRHTADGTGSLAALARRQGCDVAAIWWATAQAFRENYVLSSFGDLQRAYMDAGQWDADMPAGMALWLP